MVHHIADAEDFEKKLDEAGEKLVVIDFFATWCGPCKMIAPFFEELSGEHTDVVFLKVDVDDVEDVAAKYNVSSIPQFVFIKNKEKVDDLCGANQEKLKEILLKHK